MEIRQIETPGDVRGVLRVHQRAWRRAYSDLLPADVIDGLTVQLSDAEATRYLEEVRAPKHAFLVAVDEDGTIRGYAHLRWGPRPKPFVDPDQAGLKELYVDPEAWGNGIGTALLNAGIDRLPQNIQALTLEMLAGNDRADAFYRSRGFERIGTAETEIDGDRYPTVLYTRSLD